MVSHLRLALDSHHRQASYQDSGLGHCSGAVSSCQKHRPRLERRSKRHFGCVRTTQNSGLS